MLANLGKSGIILTNIDNTVANGLRYVGTIDKKLYSCVTKDISTDELFITEKPNKDRVVLGFSS